MASVVRNALAQSELQRLAHCVTEGDVDKFKSHLEGINFADTNIYNVPWYCLGVDLAFAKALVAASFDMNTCWDKAAVHLAVEHGNLDLLRYLVEEAGADVNLFTSNGDTALHCLIRQDCVPQRLACLRYLLDCPDTLPDLTNKHRWSPLLLAVYKKDGEPYVRTLLSLRPLEYNMDTIKLKGTTPRKKLSSVFPELRESMPGGRRGLRADERELFDFLEKCSDHEACEKLKAFLNVASKAEALKLQDEREWTLLQAACHSGAREAVRLLLSWGADVNLSSNRSDAPIHLASRNGDVTILDMLLARPNVCLDLHEQGETLMHILVRSSADSEEYVAFMARAYVERADEVNMKDALGRTPLHYAIMHQRENRVLELLNNGGRVDMPDGKGRKPINIIKFETLKKFYDSKVSTNGRGPNDKKYEILLDYSQLLRKHKGGYFYEFPSSLLYDIKREERLSPLLTHPILGYIIFVKWRFLRFLVVMNMILFLLFAFSLTAHLLLGAHHQGNSLAASATYFSSCVLLGILFIFELFHLIGYPSVYFHSLDSQMRGVVLVVSLLTVVFRCSSVLLSRVYPCRSVYSCAQYHACPHLSAFAVLFIWFEFFFIFGKIPTITFYVDIFRSAFFLLVKFVLIHLPIIVGFGLCFNVLFSGAGTPDNPFETGTSSLFKTMIMVTGEYDASEIPFDTLPITSHIVFIIFISTISIVLFNLLIGLAASATKDIEDKPFEYACRAQVWLIVRFERIFFTQSNWAQRSMHNVFWSHLCSLVLGFVYGKTENVRKYDYGVKQDTSDFIVRIQPNDRNRMNRFFIFTFHPNVGVIVQKRRQMKYKLGREIVKGAKRVLEGRGADKQKTESELGEVKRKLDALLPLVDECRRLNERIEVLLQARAKETVQTVDAVETVVETVETLL